MEKSSKEPSLGLGPGGSPGQPGECSGAQGAGSGCEPQAQDFALFPERGLLEPQERGGASGSAAEQSGPLANYGASLLTVAACIGLSFAMRGVFDPANLIMVYLLGTIYIAITRGLGPAFLATVLGVLAFDLIFVPPLYIIAVSDTQYLFTVATMFGVAVIVGKLTKHLSAQMLEVRAKEAQTRIMLSMTRELAGARGAERLLTIATGQVSRLYGFLSVAYLDEAGGLALGQGASPSVRSARFAGEAVHWVLANGQPAGLGTSTHASAEAMYLPMAGVEGTLAVLAVWPQPLGSAFAPEQVTLLENLARQVGLMLELERLEGERLRHQMEAESERLKTSLLSSVTHDLQTPLATIMGSAESLISHGDDMGTEERNRLATNMYDEAARLSRLVSNLLRMTKLESGAVKPDFQLQPIDEPLGAALVLMEQQMAGRSLSVDIPADLPLLALDGVLMEQYFLNLLENAVKYTPAGSAVDVSARLEQGAVVVDVADRGPGLAGLELDKLFDLFYQGGAAAAQPAVRKGYGVGLALCRAIAQVHGGALAAENRQGGGAVFRMTLPMTADHNGLSQITEER